MKLTELGNFSSSKLAQRLEQKFGYKLKTGALSEAKAKELLARLNKNIAEYKKKNGHLLSETNPQYTQLLVMRDSVMKHMEEAKASEKKEDKKDKAEKKMKKESIDVRALRRAVELSESADRVPSRYLKGLKELIKLAESMKRRSLLAEGELEKSQAILAARDLVDRLQGMLEDVSSMVNEELPPLVDIVRDQISPEAAATFNSEVSGQLSSLLDTVRQTRTAVDLSTRALTGEQPAAMPGAMPAGGPAAGPAGAAAGAPPAPDMPGPDTTPGGGAELGRELR